MEKWWVETWKRRPKIQLNREKSASASPGRPRRSYPGGIDTFPHLGSRLGLGTKCTVWSCLLLLVCHRWRPTRIVSALMFRKNKLRCFSAPLVICYFACIAFGWTFACFHSSIDFRQKKSVYGQCLPSEGKKRSESLNSLYTTWNWFRTST